MTFSERSKGHNGSLPALRVIRVAHRTSVGTSTNLHITDDRDLLGYEWQFSDKQPGA
jgi:hypothetical protein